MKEGEIMEQATTIKRSVEIEVREWFDKTNGNSYFSARVFTDGKLAFTLPFQYGYEDHSKYTALKELFSRGYIAPELEKYSFTALSQTLGIDFIYHKSEALKREMFKAESNA